MTFGTPLMCVFIGTAGARMSTLCQKLLINRFLVKLGYTREPIGKRGTIVDTHTHTAAKNKQRRVVWQVCRRIAIFNLKSQPPRLLLVQHQ